MPTLRANRTWISLLQAGKLAPPGYRAKVPGPSDKFSGENTDCDMDTQKSGLLKYLPLTIGNTQVNGLIDSGCNVNIVSLDLYNCLAVQVKSGIDRKRSLNVKVADNSIVKCLGTVSVVLEFKGGKRRVEAYLMEKTSTPLILGTGFLVSVGAKLDFSKNQLEISKVKLRAKNTISLPAKSESIVVAKVPTSIPIGTTGMCVGNYRLVDQGVIMSKSVGIVSSLHTIPVKILNPNDSPIDLNRNSLLAELHLLDDQCIITPMLDSPSSHQASINHAVTCANQATTDSAEKQAFLHNFHLDKLKELRGEQQQQIKNLLWSYSDIFVTKENPDIGLTPLVQHKIHVDPHAKLPHQRPYRLSPDKKIVLRDQLEELVERGVIIPVRDNEEVPITSPIVLVSKPKASGASQTGKEANLAQWRFCTDFRALNRVTTDSHYNIPDLQELVESFAEYPPNFITTLDLSHEFHQIGVEPDSSKFIAFNTCFGTFKYLRLPMGLKTSPNTMQLLMDKVLKGLTFKSCLSYLDDLIITSSTFQNHLSEVSEVFSRLRDANLKIGPKKCSFAQTKCIFLGHEVSKEGVHPPPDRVEKIRNLPYPKTIQELRRTIGLFNWFRKFIPNFSTIAAPLLRLMRKGSSFRWGDIEKAAFESLKSQLLTSDILAFPRYDVPFRLAVDTSCEGTGYMLYQIHSESEFPEGTSEKERSRVVRSVQKP